MFFRFGTSDTLNDIRFGLINYDVFHVWRIQIISYDIFYDVSVANLQCIDEFLYCCFRVRQGCRDQVDYSVACSTGRRLGDGVAYSDQSSCYPFVWFFILMINIDLFNKNDFKKWLPITVFVHHRTPLNPTSNRFAILDESQRQNYATKTWSDFLQPPSRSSSDRTEPPDLKKIPCD